MPKECLRIYIPNHCLERMEHLASNFFPVETGGLLVGYSNPKHQVKVVTDIIGPGPDAKHNRTSFIPDYDYQEKELRKIYEKSIRTNYYIGDWHTHPGNVHLLSNKDKQTMKNISDYPPARTPFPIMTILANKDSKWTIQFWQLKYKRFVIKYGYKIDPLEHIKF